MRTVFETIVVELPATPLGLLPPRWVIHHHCTVCRYRVATDDLIRHAQAHVGVPIDAPTDRDS